MTTLKKSACVKRTRDGPIEILVVMMIVRNYDGLYNNCIEIMVMLAMRMMVTATRGSKDDAGSDDDDDGDDDDDDDDAR